MGCNRWKFLSSNRHARGHVTEKRGRLRCCVAGLTMSSCPRLVSRGSRSAATGGGDLLEDNGFARSLHEACTTPALANICAEPW